ncbi:MAG TPA: hypothetical protein VN721_13035 [Flavipsychrobacter sp.]|nr:hypothetical protein [Flavipsychrobacter sp.]
MHNTHKLLTLALGSSLLFAACQGHVGTVGSSAGDTTAKAPVNIKLADVGTSPEFPNATLMIKSVNAMKGKDTSKVVFNFDVKNYELKMQTSDTGNKVCNNSAKGQHIHFILDNKPYQALYAPVDTVSLPNNTEHYLVAFLSRSYHQSLKNKEAVVMYHFKLDDKGNMQKLDNPTTPMLVYSRPKGDYIGKDTANILLDFYVLNCNLAKDGYKVKAMIENGTRSLDTTLTDWKSYFIQNLGTGKCQVTLSLLDKDGKPLAGPLTSETRNFTLAAQEPMK